MNLSAYPDAVVVLTADEVAADRERWLEARRRGIGGSDASSVIGLNEWSSPYRLWLDKTGRSESIKDNDPMMWGRYFEPGVRAWFSDTTGITVTAGGLLQHRERPWQVFSPDGLCSDGGILEIKTCGTWTTDADIWADGEIPDHAEIQAQHGMAVTGATHAHIAACVGGQTGYHHVVERDEKTITVLTDAEDAFWHVRVLKDVPPPIDGLPATTEALRRRYARSNGATVMVDRHFADDIAELERVKLRLKSIEGEKAEIENRLRAAFGHAETMQILGEEVATYRANGTFASNQFAEDHPDLYEEYLVGPPAFDPHALAADHPQLYAQYRARVLRITRKKGTPRG